MNDDHIYRTMTGAKVTDTGSHIGITENIDKYKEEAKFKRQLSDAQGGLSKEMRSLFIYPNIVHLAILKEYRLNLHDGSRRTFKKVFKIIKSQYPHLLTSVKPRIFTGV